MVQTWGGEKRIERPWIFLVYNFKNKVRWNFNQNTSIFIHENIVCEMVAIFSGGDQLKIRMRKLCAV